jgi:hypothetical protein
VALYIFIFYFIDRDIDLIIPVPHKGFACIDILCPVISVTFKVADIENGIRIIGYWYRFV